MYGLGRSLPRGESLFVPFNCDVIIGEELPNSANASELIQSLTNTYKNLLGFCMTRNTLD